MMNLPVYMMLFLDGKRAYIATGQKVKLSEWDEKSGRFIGNNAKGNTINEFLDRMRMDVIRIYNEMRSKLEDITVDELRKSLKGGQGKKEVRRWLMSAKSTIQVLKNWLGLRLVKSLLSDMLLLLRKLKIL
jgi:hypothetical protein